MKILALDLGKYKTVACNYEAETSKHNFKTVATTPQALHDLIVDLDPDRVVIEICSIAGWVCDLVRTLGITIQVANTSDEMWRWRKVKQKNDRRDALKAAQLSAVNQLREVHVPEKEIRQWRALINYRQQLVGRRTKIKNHIRDLLQREGELLERGQKAWTEEGIAALEALAQPLAELSLAELWRGELRLELEQLKEIQQQLRVLEVKLNELGAADHGVQILRTAPGVGPRLAEAVVAMLDNPRRFRNASEVSAYIGMVPKQLDSGEPQRSGTSPVTAIGWCGLLVEVAWCAPTAQSLGARNLSTHQRRQEITEEDCDCRGGQKVIGALLGHAAKATLAVWNQSTGRSSGLKGIQTQKTK